MARPLFPQPRGQTFVAARISAAALIALRQLTRTLISGRRQSTAHASVGRWHPMPIHFNASSEQRLIMVGNDNGTSLRRLFLRRHSRIGRAIARVVVVTGAILAVALSSFAAEMTPDELMGNSVKGRGPHIADLQDAINKFRDREYDDARRLLEEAKKKTAKLPPPELMLAKLFASSNQVVEFRAELESCTRKWPNDPEAYVVLAEADASENRFTAARLLFNKGASLAETFKENSTRKVSALTSAYSGLSAIEEVQQNWTAAKDAAAAMLKIDPENAATHARMGRILFRMNQPDEAFKSFQKATAKEENGTPAEVAMATMYQVAGDRDKVREWLAKAVEKGATDVTTQLAVANLKLQTNQVEEAAKHVEAARKIDPQNLDAKILGGIISRKQRDFDKARKFLESAHVQSPSNTTVMNHLALALLEIGGEAERRRAVEFAEINFRSNTSSAEAAGTLGWVYYRLGRVNEANNYLAAAIRAKNASPDLYFYVATVYSKMGRGTEATAILDAALKSTNIFFYRKDAEALYKDLAKKNRKSGAATDASSDDADAKAQSVIESAELGASDENAGATANSPTTKTPSTKNPTPTSTKKRN